VYARPQRLEQGADRAYSVLPRREVSLAVACRLRNRVRTAGIDAARHLAAVELSLRVPAQKFLDHVLMSQAQQRARHQGPVTNPKCAGTSAVRAQCRPIALRLRICASARATVLAMRASDSGTRSARGSSAAAISIRALRVLLGEPAACKGWHRQRPVAIGSGTTSQTWRARPPKMHVIPRRRMHSRSRPPQVVAAARSEQ